MSVGMLLAVSCSKVNSPKQAEDQNGTPAPNSNTASVQDWTKSVSAFFSPQATPAPLTDARPPAAPAAPAVATAAATPTIQPNPAQGAKEAALKMYPQLGVKDSMFNKTFRDLPLPTDEKRLTLAKEVIQAFDDLHGVFPGHRPAHAKGIIATGSFTPTAEAAGLSIAPHFQAETPVFIRFSNFAGVPMAADNKPDEASPRGCAVRFQLGAHKHTDIVAHSVDSFPTRTAQEFIEFLHAVKASGPDVPHPTPIEQFLGSHPKALAFVTTPKPIPTSFGRESYFGVSAFKFINAAGAEQFVRYRILPEAGNEYLSAEEAAAKDANFLMDGLAKQLAPGPVKMQLWVQLGEAGDVTDDATTQWPAERKQVLLGTISLTGLLPSDDIDGRRIIFDPIPRVAGIEPSADPLLEPRADVYVMSGRRRREQAGI